MKAKIFYIKDDNAQKEIVEDLKEYLRDILYGNMDIETHAIPANYNYGSEESAHQAMDTYIRLLRASMLKLNDFHVKIENSSGNWCYLGGEHSEYSSLYTNNITLKENQVKAMFPALSLMNRMVLLPEGIDELFNDLHKDNFNFLFKPLDLEGISLIDFENRIRVSNMLTHLKNKLELEIAKYCNRYMELKNSPYPDYNVLSKLLNVKERYLTGLEKIILNQKSNSESLINYIKITPKVLNDSVKYKETSTVRLEFNKETEIPIDEVYIEIRAPFQTIENNIVKTSMKFSLETSETKIIEFPLTAQAKPFCPIEVRFRFNELVFGNNPIPFPIPLIINVN
jgi:hypothetical protein